MDQKPLVLVTGISGFIGAHVFHQFIQNGGFRVRGTLRKINEQSTAPFKKLLGDQFDQVEIVEADLNNEQSIIDACEGCTYVAHTASPVNYEVSVQTAVDGTLAAMKGALKHKVKKVVVTSSIAAIWCKTDKTQMKFGPSDWSDIEACDNAGSMGEYFKSKTLAEKAAWDFIKDLKDEDKFELTTINPGLVYGPSLNGRYSLVGEFFKGFVEKGFTMPNDAWVSVCVRDVAEAHLMAILKPKSSGQRFILVEREYWIADAYNLLVDALPNKNLTKAPSDGDNSKIRSYDNSNVKQDLCIPFITSEQTIKDTIKQMVETGYFES